MLSVEGTLMQRGSRKRGIGNVEIKILAIAERLKLHERI